MADNTTILNTFPGHLQTVAQNSSFPDECVKVKFSKMEYLPWDNPDNIVSKELEYVVHTIKNNMVALLFLIGGPNNVINMAVFYKQGLQDRVNLCLFALALADELFLVILMLLNAEQLVFQFTTKEQFGPVLTFLTNNSLTVFIASCFISPVLSSIIAIERCLCVFNPLKFQSLLRTRTMVVIIIVVYILMFGMFSIVSFRYRIGCTYDPDSGVLLTTITEGEFYKAHKEFISHLYSFVFGVGLPGVEMIVATTTTIMTIVKLRQIMTWRSGTSSSISAREVALTKMLVGNSILFITCLSPVALFRIVQLFMPEMNTGRRNHNFYLTSVWISEIFTNINATFNFFVYYVMGSRYRETFWALFGKKIKASKSLIDTST